MEVVTMVIPSRPRWRARSWPCVPCLATSNKSPRCMDWAGKWKTSHQVQCAPTLHVYIYTLFNTIIYIILNHIRLYYIILYYTYIYIILYYIISYHIYIYKPLYIYILLYYIIFFPQIAGKL